MANQQAIQRLLRPRTVAVVGGNWAAEVIRQCDKIGFDGEIWPVNPKRDEMVGRRCYATVADLPAGPDATFIGVPRAATIEVVSALNKMGAGGAVCFASGFAETGDAEGQRYDDALRDAIGDMAIVGPNCYGVLNYLDGVTLWPDEQGGKRIERGAAIITQSGNIAISMSMQQRSLPLAYLISTGNQAGVTIPEYIEALLEDERVTAIGLHLEGLDNVVAFSRAAVKALAKKVPLVVLKTGASDLASELTQSHTSSLAGSDELYGALFERVGIMRARSIPELLEAVKFLSVVGPLPTPSLATISSSGGEAALVADTAQRFRLDLPALVTHQEAALLTELGERVALSNPLDYHTYIWGDPPAQQRAFAAMMLGEQAVTVKILDFPRPDICDPHTWVETARAFARAAAETGVRGAMLATVHENFPESIREEMLAAGIAPMLGMDELFAVIAGAAKIAAAQARQAEIVPLTNAVESDAPLVSLDEQASKRLVAQYGLTVPASAEINPSNATTIANQLGYPLVLKVLSAEILHKSDVGGVKVGLENSAEVAAAVADMAHLSDRFLLEKMADKPLMEMLVGVTRDPQFGLALVIGAGGVLVELFADSQTLLFPVTRRDVTDALGRLKIAPLLHGYRGSDVVDIDVLVDAVMAVAAFAEGNSAELFELDINPLFVYPNAVVAVDAVVRMHENP